MSRLKQSIAMLGGLTQYPKTYWVTDIYGPSYQFSLAANGRNSRSFIPDSSGNAWFCGRYATSSFDNGMAMVGKLNAASGALQFVKEPATNVTVSNLDQLACGPSGAVYGSGLSQGSNNGANIVKFNSDGTMAWQKQVDHGGYPDMDCGPIKIDSSENLYVPQYTGTGYGIIATKMSSTGALLGSLKQATDGNISGYSIGDVNFDSAGNVIIVTGKADSGGTYLQGTVVKATLAGTALWSAVFDIGGGVSVKWAACEVDSTDNIFASATGPSNSVLVAKYSSAGALLFKKQYFNGSTVSAFSMRMDAANTLYIAAIIGQTIHIAKVKSSDGSVVWGRSMGISTSVSVGSVSVYADLDYLWVSFGYLKSGWSGSGSLVMAKLPTDGSRTGSYAMTGVNGAYTLTVAASAPATSVVDVSTITTGAYASLTSGVMAVTYSNLWQSPATLTANQSLKPL